MLEKEERCSVLLVNNSHSVSNELVYSILESVVIDMSTLQSNTSFCLLEKYAMNLFRLLILILRLLFSLDVWFSYLVFYIFTVFQLYLLLLFLLFFLSPSLFSYYNLDDRIRNFYDRPC
jgi:ABC-type polysaccharide/polyol phosphate export permease